MSGAAGADAAAWIGAAAVACIACVVAYAGFGPPSAVLRAALTWSQNARVSKAAETAASESITAPNAPQRDARHDRRDMRELAERDQEPEDQHLGHAPRARRDEACETSLPGAAARVRSATASADRPCSPCAASASRAWSRARGRRAAHAVAVQDAGGAEERRLDEVAVHRKSHDWKRVRNREQHDGPRA